MPGSNQSVSFLCRNEQCDQKIEVNLGFHHVPGWALCGCGYGYLVDSSRSTVRAVDDSGMIESYDGDAIDMEISQTLEEIVGMESVLQGRMLTVGARNEFLSFVSAQGAVTMDAIPLPIELVEEQGFGIPEAHVIKIMFEAAPPALRTISKYYAEEVEKVKEEFEAE
jgi:hypothetical protein